MLSKANGRRPAGSLHACFLPRRRKPSTRPQVTHKRWSLLIAVPLACLPLGCGFAPKTFRKVVDPAPIVRARSVGLGGKLPQGNQLRGAV